MRCDFNSLATPKGRGSTKSWPAFRCIRGVVVIAAFLRGSLACSETAILSEMTRWAVAPSLTTRAGHDSNIFARADGSADTFAEVEPVIQLSRPNSLTLLTIDLYAKATAFLAAKEENSIDPALRVRYRYPDHEDVLSTSELKASFSRASVANPDLGRRVRETDLAARWEASFFASGKSTLRTRLAAQQLAYDEIDLNANESVDAGIMLAVVSNEKFQLGAGYGLLLSRSIPESALRDWTHRVENSATFQGRGEFTAQVSGQFYLGLANANYSGALRRSEVDVVAGSNVEWRISDQLSLLLRADRRVYFSAEGDAVRETSLGIEAEQTFADRFTARVGARGIRSVYRRVIVYRHDESLPFHASVDYIFHRQITARVEGTWSRQTSEWDFRNFQRSTFVLSGQYRF